MLSATCIAPVNIALIKYWGKRNEELILPINDSISMTLSTNEMCAKTTIATAETFKQNRMWLNGEEVPFEENERLMRCLRAIQILALANGSLKAPITWKLHIASHNNFPTAAGLASSAAGYACLVYTLAKLYDIPQSEDLTAIARQGSGSACRSLYGGFVHWHRGNRDDGRDSIALPIIPAIDWPDMHVLILVVNDARKKTASSKGMKRSVNTSALIQYRAKHVVPDRTQALIEAIETRNFGKFAEISMKDSNQFHAIALDTYPPCVYMNDISHSIVNFVHAYNEASAGYGGGGGGGGGGGARVAYTFDAGPNACLYVLAENVAKLLAAIQMAFPNDNGQSVEYLQGIPIIPNATTNNSDDGAAAQKKTPSLEPHLDNNNDANIVVHSKNLLKYIIHTKIGEGPRQLFDDDDSLLIDGMPRIN